MAMRQGKGKTTAASEGNQRPGPRTFNADDRLWIRFNCLIMSTGCRTRLPLATRLEH